MKALTVFQKAVIYRPAKIFALRDLVITLNPNNCWEFLLHVVLKVSKSFCFEKKNRRITQFSVSVSPFF
jgi:hypothetical protein